MSPHLRQLLDEAVPEPVRRLDADDVLHAARRHRRVRRSYLTATAVVLALLAVGVPTFLVPRDNPSLPAAQVPLHLSALDRRAPLGETAAGTFTDKRLVHPGQGSRVATVSGREVWLLEVVGDQLCVLFVNEKVGGSGGSCHPRSNLLTTGVTTPIFVKEDSDAFPTEESDPEAIVVVVVPDGYTSAAAAGSTATVANNVALLAFDPAPRGKLTVDISGPRVPGRQFSLDHFTVGVPTRDDSSGPPIPDSEASARLLLEDVGEAAEEHAQRNGTTDGFGLALQADAPRLRASLHTLTDTIAVARAGDGRCLSIDLRTRRITEAGC